MRNVWKKWMGMALAGAMLVQTGGALVFAAGEDETAVSVKNMWLSNR